MQGMGWKGYRSDSAASSEAHGPCIQCSASSALEEVGSGGAVPPVTTGNSQLLHMRTSYVPHPSS